eukprot:TRINITY_DN2762_c0_g1_i1.p1 TRINITY_DN2762_c0_g1~~TRINITY_DN2762_c0_g1_i1.p1  ORF type:complete len:457 (-),score=147.95 TRINITY_DN2762_c0_g1_i1:1818-3188(-)
MADNYFKIRQAHWSSMKETFENVLRENQVEFTDVCIFMDNRGKPTGDCVVRCPTHVTMDTMNERGINGYQLNKKTWSVIPCDQRDYDEYCSFKTEPMCAIRLRGVPFTVEIPDLIEFFASEIKMEKDAIVICSDHGRSSGEAYALFANENETDEIINKLDGKKIGRRYIECFKTSKKEFEYYRELNKRNDSYERDNRSRRDSSRDDSGEAYIRVRGLPFRAPDDEVVDFFAKGNCFIRIDDIHHKYGRDGRKSGEAFIKVNPSELDNALSLDREYLQRRYLEISTIDKRDCERMLGMSLSGRRSYAPPGGSSYGGGYQDNRGSSGGYGYGSQSRGYESSGGYGRESQGYGGPPPSSSSYGHSHQHHQSSYQQQQPPMSYQQTHSSSGYGGYGSSVPSRSSSSSYGGYGSAPQPQQQQPYYSDSGYGSAPQQQQPYGGYGSSSSSGPMASSSSYGMG